MQKTLANAVKAFLILFAFVAIAGIHHVTGIMANANADIANTKVDTGDNEADELNDGEDSGTGEDLADEPLEEDDQAVGENGDGNLDK